MHQDPRSIPTAPTMVRINPSSWSQAFGYDQGQVRTAPSRFLTVAGQGSFDSEGRLLHDGDVAGQLTVAMANVAEVVDRAGLALTDLAQLRIYVTDIGAALAGYGAVVERLARAGATPPATLVEVRALAYPGMAVEIDAIAVR